MKNNNILGLKNKEIFSMLNDWSHIYLQNKMDSVKFQFSNKLAVGRGLTKLNINNNSYEIQVGTAPITPTFFTRNQIINDLDFIKTGVTMYHEFTHHDQNSSKDTSPDILISDLSKYQNMEYYRKNWAKLVHEIDAEYTGVISMWSRLNESYPDKADELMFEYLTHRASETDYMINIPEDGFQSKDQVNDLFEKAYNKSLTEKRGLPLDFLRSEDEIARLFTTDDNILRTEYYPFYRQLLTADTGKESNLKMASIVSYLHPELQNIYSELDFTKLNPSSVFGISMPETLKEIQNRIGTKYEQNIFSSNDDQTETTDFTVAVNNIPINLSDRQL